MDAYLVAAGGTASPYAGVVRRERHVWRIMLFGVPDKQQPKDVFATRDEAGKRLLELATHADGPGPASG